ncbi:MAG: hypothetical protein NTZ42_02850 [Candidatus Gribaldobacteria bacterium]|nr:hypothetical protein [Candidatus Gribaldobacteria bacterium]
MINNKIINTRVSKKLYEKISVEAKKNRTNVSNLIRNLVEDALEIHEDIHEAVDKKIRKYLSETEKQNILGYQEYAGSVSYSWFFPRGPSSRQHYFHAGKRISFY